MADRIALKGSISFAHLAFGRASNCVPPEGRASVLASLESIPVPASRDLSLASRLAGGGFR